MAFLAPLLKQHFEDENGNPLSGGFVYTYVANSTTPIATYLDPDAESANENPIELDSRGECVIYIQQGTAYKFVVQNADEETIYTIDDVALSEFSETGEPGAPGEAATIAVGTVNSVLYGEPATVTNVGTSSAAIFNFEIPWGETGAQGENGIQGSQGEPGTAATITIGTVDTVPFEDPATVTNSGTTTEAIFDFEIPQGADGATGAAGTSIHTGSGVPSGGLGNDGDVYIDADTGEIYSKSGTWSLEGEITGGIVGTDITGKTANTTPATDDLLVMSDTSDSGNLKKITLENLLKFVPSLTQKSTPVAADIIAIADSAASNATKYTTVANVTAAVLGTVPKIHPVSQRFTASGTYNLPYAFIITSGNATTGATYTNNSVTFTVVNTVASATLVHMTGSGAPAASGTLTKASGTGDTTLTFSSALAPTYLEITAAGGGAGGPGGGNNGTGGAGGAGGDTTFGGTLVVAVGGGSTGQTGNGTPAGASFAAPAYNAGSAPGSISGYTAIASAIASFGAGLPGGDNVAFGGGGRALANAAGGNAVSNTGGGGAGGGWTLTTGADRLGSGGVSGGTAKAIVPGPLSATYAVVIGAGGTAGTLGTNGYAGGAGGSGQLWATAHYQ